MFINKVVLEHSYAQPFLCCLWPPSLYNGRVEKLDRDLMASKPKMFAV